MGLLLREGAVMVRPPDGLTFDWWVAILSLVFTGGLFVDGWAHNHLDTIDTFFTPWHAMFYGGFGLLVLFFAWTMVANHAKGFSWSRSVPAGYEWSIIGIAVFLVSGLGDMLWHMFFGIEVSTEALLSPTHLGLATGGVLMLAGPFRAAVAREPERTSGAASYLPAVLSLAAVFTVLTFMTQFAPALGFYGTGPKPPQAIFELKTDRGVVSQLFQAALMASIILLAVRQFGARLPAGSITLILTINAAMMATQGDTYWMLPGVFATGVLSDVLLYTLKPSVARVVEFRTFAFAVPSLYAACHYLTLFALGRPVYYSVHLWAGLIVISGIIGLLLSFVALPNSSVPADMRA